MAHRSSTGAVTAATLARSDISKQMLAKHDPYYYARVEELVGELKCKLLQVDGSGKTGKELLNFVAHGATLTITGTKDGDALDKMKADFCKLDSGNVATDPIDNTFKIEPTDAETLNRFPNLAKRLDDLRFVTKMLQHSTPPEFVAGAVERHSDPAADSDYIPPSHQTQGIYLSTLPIYPEKFPQDAMARGAAGLLVPARSTCCTRLPAACDPCTLAFSACSAYIVWLHCRSSHRPLCSRCFRCV